EGQIGFVNVELENAAINATGVSVSVDLAAPGNTISFSDLTAQRILELSTITVAGGPVSLTADVAVSAVLPGGGEPFDLGSATLSLTWADASNPLDVTVSLTGGIADLMKAKVTSSGFE